MWEPCSLTIWVPDEDDDALPSRRSSLPLPNQNSVSTPQYYVIRYPSIGGVSNTYIQKTYPNRHRRVQGTRNSNSHLNPNPSPSLNPTPNQPTNQPTNQPPNPPPNPSPKPNPAQNQNPNPTRNPQRDNQSSQRVNTSNRRETTTSARNPGSNVTTSNKRTPLKSILKISSSSGKKVRFANPLANNMSAPEAQARRPSFTAATRGSNTPRSMPSSPIRSDSPGPEGAQNNSHHGQQNNSRHRSKNNMEQWDLSSSSSSNEDDDPTIPRTLHTPQRGTWQFLPSQGSNENKNTNTGNSRNSSNLGGRRGHQPPPVRLGSPPPEYTSSPGNSPPLSTRSRGSRRSKPNEDSETEENIDDLGHDYLTAGGVAHAKAAHLQRNHKSDRQHSSRRSSRRWEYVPIYLGRRGRPDTRAWSYRPHIRQFPASFEHLRNNFNSRADRPANNNTNNEPANGGTDAPQPPPHPTVEDAPDDVQW